MPKQTSTIFGLAYGWEAGENGWGDDMSANILTIETELDKAQKAGTTKLSIEGQVLPGEYLTIDVPPELDLGSAIVVGYIKDEDGSSTFYGLFTSANDSAFIVIDDANSKVFLYNNATDQHTFRLVVHV